MTTLTISQTIDQAESNALFQDENWQRCFEDFLREIYQRSGSISSYANYRSQLMNFFKRDPARDPASYGRRDVQEWIARTSTNRGRNFGKPISASTANFTVTCITSFYKFASAWEVSPGQFLFEKALPTWGMRARKRTQESRAMTESELEALFSNIDRSTTIGKRDFALLCMYLLTCRRRREIIRLVWGDLEQTTIVEKDGTRRPGVVYRAILKGNQRAERTFELPQTAYLCLLDYLQAAGRLEKMQPESPLFTGVNNGQARKNSSVVYDAPLTPSAVVAIFKSRLRSAGIPPQKYGIHALRHSGASMRWIAKAGDLFDIQAILAHQNVSTTYRYLSGLTGVSDKGSEKVVERLKFLVPAQS